MTRRQARAALLIAVLATGTGVSVPARSQPPAETKTVPPRLLRWPVDVDGPHVRPEDARPGSNDPGGAGAAGGRLTLFNRDQSGVPQNEESVTACRTRPQVVLGGTNDYRKRIPGGGRGKADTTGWHLSLDGGATVANDGLLPGVTALGVSLPSGGDPVVAASPDCHLYAASLNYTAVDEKEKDKEQQTSAVSLYRSDPETLAACAGGPACWTETKVAAASRTRFLDKEWFDVGPSGPAGVVVWVAWTEFHPTGPEGEDFTSSIRAARCRADLAACTEPMLVSGDDRDVQWADVTIGPDGRTYLTWSEILGLREEKPQTFVHKLRVAPAGSTHFGPERVVAVERSPIGFDDHLHADDFRIATYPKHAVTMVGGRPRVFVTWERCPHRPLGTACEEPTIVVRSTDDDGRTWSPSLTVSAGGDNYFPAIAADPTTGRLAVAYFTNRADPFHHRQELELVTLEAATSTVVRRQTLSPSNEPDADPYLGGRFIGDYFEVFAHAGQAFVHFNANYRAQQLTGVGIPVLQQDNFLARARL